MPKRVRERRKGEREKWPLIKDAATSSTHQLNQAPGTGNTEAAPKKRSTATHKTTKAPRKQGGPTPHDPQDEGNPQEATQRNPQDSHGPQESGSQTSLTHASAHTKCTSKKHSKLWALLLFSTTIY
eukprot:gnl/MRDRNA2_/MRDRNA2_93326_c0_seq1.p1 gnl/MRDRNA2_/MRDRNA2_93326_c0~~gnl/MRDRNA2_/MRDRNA2_93326_c0_seq1.p1  ORF type:complete len:126 (-),score=0.14 gnl/MRDRNA2_/MRDRNA2_93326_c0_seq1:267-644(-)